MGRLFSVALLSAVLLLVPSCPESMPAQPVFFSMLFPQLIPPCLLERTEGADACEATAGEAMQL